MICVYALMSHGVMLRSEDELKELVLSSYLWVPRIEFRKTRPVEPANHHLSFCLFLKQSHYVVQANLKLLYRPSRP